MHFTGILLIVLFCVWNMFLTADGNAMLKPFHRGMMWTRRSYNSAGYNYMGINCGGTGKLKHNNGKCGLCGDAFDGARNHETGGKYATGAIADVIGRGQRNIYVKILLNSDQGGYFEFRLCAKNQSAETQACFDKHLLKISEGRHQGDEFAYIVQRAGITPLTIEIPERVYCDKCVLQWKYVTANTFGRDEHGAYCLGCGVQETFANCADITIKGWEIPTTPVPPTTPIPTTMMWTTTTVAPTTTTIPTTQLPTTTPYRQNQITKARPTKNTQPVTKHATRQRYPVTDVDEGSRRRFTYARYPAAVAAVPAPRPKTPAVVPPSVVQPEPLNVVKTQPKEVVQPSPAVVKVPDKSQNVNMTILPEIEHRKPPSYRAKKRSGPFKIPRPPKLSYEQIDALNNNKNIIPHHDPKQKYVKVGSSRIIAGVDFTTLRAQQVQTPPTTSNAALNVNVPAQGAHSNHNDKAIHMFSSFGDEMMGAPAEPQNQPNQNLDMNIMNEYSMVPESSNKGSDQRRPYQNLQSVGLTKPPAKTTRGNRHFPLDMYDSLPSVQNQAPKMHSRSFSINAGAQLSLDGSNMFRTSGRQSQPEVPKSSMNHRQQKQFHNSPQIHNQRQQTYQPSHRRADFPSGVDMYGNPVNEYQNNKVEQNVGTVFHSRYGQILSKKQPVLNHGSINPAPLQSGSDTSKRLNSYTQNNKQNHRSIQTPMDYISSGSKTTKLPVIDTSTQRGQKTKSINNAQQRNFNLNDAILQDTPVKLFDNKERNSFKAPVVFERYTNYKVGGGKNTPNAMPEELRKHNSLQQNKALKNESYHLNSGIHSPEKYFGQDHYIAHDVELRYPAFGGTNTQDSQSQLALSLGPHDVQQSPDRSQSYNDAHFNAALHSPVNYFPHQNIPTHRNTKNQNKQRSSVQTGLYEDELLLKIMPSTSTQPTTTTTTTTAAPTTNLIDYQMQELNKLREKMERLQQMILMKTSGVQPERSSSGLTQNKKTFVSQANNDVPMSSNINTAYRNKQNSYNQNSYIQKNIQNFENKVDRPQRTDLSLWKPTTVQPGWRKETTKFINNFKTQMLQSINQANAMKKQNAPNTLLTKPNNEEKTTYVTPNPSSDIQQKRHRVMQTEQQHVNKRMLQTGKATDHQININQDQDKREKYRILLELLIKRRKEKRLVDQQTQQNELKTEQQQGSQLFKTRSHDYKQVSHSRLAIDQHQNQVSNKYRHQSPKQQYVQPKMAEINTFPIKKQKISQKQQTTSIRPVQTLEPSTRISMVKDHKQQESIDSGSAVKTTIDTLADRLAAGMAKKLGSGNNGGVPNFQVLPLSSDSVMSALRNIAVSVLKGQDVQKHLTKSPTTTTNDITSSSLRPKYQSFVKPDVREMHATRGLKKQKKINVNEIGTKANRIDSATAAKNHASQKERKQIQNGSNSKMSPEKLAKRQELIRKMKAMMLGRRQKLKINQKTRTDRKPSESAPIKSSIYGQTDLTRNAKSDISLYRTEKANNVGNLNKYDRQSSTTINDNVSPTAYGKHDEPQQNSNKNRQQTIVNVGSSKMSQYSNSSQGINDKARVRMSPDIAKAMLSRVRHMLASQKRNTAGSNAGGQEVATKDVLVMPLNKQMLYKLLQSMRKQSNTGR